MVALTVRRRPLSALARFCLPIAVRHRSSLQRTHLSQAPIFTLRLGGQEPCTPKIPNSGPLRRSAPPHRGEPSSDTLLFVKHSGNQH
jgi:hypothetical protein